MWRSLVAHTHGVRGVAGSNPVIPTPFQITTLILAVFRFFEKKKHESFL
jgi:hypothetical protein